MSETVFGGTYANVYQALYHDKDYAAECDFVETAFRAMGVPVRSILDLGCGTGGHAILLASRGYRVVGVDRSESMLAIAKRRAAETGACVEFRSGDLRSFDAAQSFDAVISMFAVMCYQTENEDLEGACATAARHLTPGGVFLFDGWYGPAVLKDPPTERLRMVEGDGRRIVRFTSPVLDTARHTVETRFTVWVTEQNAITAETRESHLMRFLFPREIAYYLRVAGFGEPRFCPFMALDRPLDDSSWQMAVMARLEADRRR
jgi:SAM-dependent methyltransferase